MTPEHVEAARASIRRGRPTGEGAIDEAVELALSPDGTQLAFTARTVAAEDADLIRAVHVLDLRSGRLGPPVETDEQSSGAAWSPDGRSLAWIADGPGGTTARWSPVVDGVAVTPVDVPAPDGRVERVSWAPDGSALLVSVAHPGAELSDVHGSGVVSGSTGPSWFPSVESGAAGGGRRSAHVVPVDGAPSRVAVDPAWNVWHAVWAGADVLAVVSAGASESDWYGAHLVRVAPDGSMTRLDVGAGQVCAPAASPSGRRASVVVGLMSDRGADTGDLVLVGPDPGTGRVLDSGGVDVTGQVWTDEDTVVVVGVRGLRTVVSRVQVSTGHRTELWDSDLTCGYVVPEVAAAGETVVVCRHGYDRPPQLVALPGDGREDTVLALAPRDPAGAPGAVEVVEWAAPDGLLVQGLLVTPDAPGPHPLVVHVHGGPVWAWRNEWRMRYPYTPLLVEQGYAVLHPNIRGSAGRGRSWIAAGLYDMGGADTDDVVAGVEHLVARGRVDPARVGITGNSYGGFAAAWLAATSDAFAAAVPRSPVTDWVSQHLTSNLPGFDQLCLSHEDPLGVDSAYRTRSPLYRAASVSTPLLLMAGANDLATPPEQATAFHRAVVESGGTSTVVIYPEEGHGVRNHDALVDQCARIVAFLQEHMPARPCP